jgi:glycosyltransferase involved in cell wall biosynthesis
VDLGKKTGASVIGRTSIVVPCYDEASRLDVSAFREWISERDSVSLLFVNDGSRDGTLALLQELARDMPKQIGVMDLGRNLGKAEAVRLGLLQMLATGAPWVGYMDADLATPLDEIDRLMQVALRSEAELVMGARVSLLGRHIERDELRHYLGRVFASAASLALGLEVYDTQCGAKLLRASPTLEAALATPFLSRWAFDVELIGRLLVPPAAGVQPLQVDQIVEEPLNEWRDKPGSKLKPLHMLRSAIDLAKIAFEMRHLRAARRRSVSG